MQEPCGCVLMAGSLPNAHAHAWRCPTHEAAERLAGLLRKVLDDTCTHDRDEAIGLLKELGR
jgi:hypothetical protein